MLQLKACAGQLLLLVGATLTATSAFVTPVVFPSVKHATDCTNNKEMHFARRRNDDDDKEYRDALALNKAKTDVRNFLTQRAIQSFIYLLVSCRDPHTVTWMENNYDFKNLENYHGTGAFNLTKWPTWDSMLLDMLGKPPDVVVISARRRGRGHGGWSKNNPYLEERFVEFEIDIDPPSLVSRIVSVREQIAREWLSDLDTIVAANDMILTSYHDTHRTAREEEECATITNDDDDVDVDDDDDCASSIEQLLSTDRKPAFDRNAQFMLSNAISFDERASSPNRKGNFDLLCLLVTQESVHRALREYQQQQQRRDRDVSYQWLRDFYIKRVEDYFDGSQEYGRADDFLDELLMTPPLMKSIDGKVELVDPLRIAEDIIEIRSKIAKEWKETMAKVPEDHMGLRRDLLAAQMGKYSRPTEMNEAAPSVNEGFE